MRSLLKLSLAAFAALMVAGGAYAAEMKITGNIGAGFGIASYGEKTNSTFTNTPSSTHAEADAMATCNSSAVTPAPGACATGFIPGEVRQTTTTTDTTSSVEASSLAVRKAYSEYTTSWESNLRFSYGDDDLMAILRFRPRGHNAGANGTGTGFTSSANDIYDEILWKPVPAFSILFGRLQGPGWSNPLAGSYLILNPMGAPDYWMNWTGVSGIDLEYNAGIVQVGLAISSQCKPSCGFGNITGVTNGALTFAAQAQQNTQTMAPHVTGKVGDIAFRAMFPSTSGDVVTDASASSTNTTASVTADVNTNELTSVGTAPTNPVANANTTTVTETRSSPANRVAATESITGSGYQVGVSWTGMPGLGVALDLQSFTDAVTKAQKEGAKDLTRSAMAFKVDYMGAQLAYHTLTWGLKAACKGECGDQKDKTDTFMKIGYALKVGAGTIIPEFTTRTLGLATQKVNFDTGEQGKPADATDTLIRIVGNMTF